MQEKLILSITLVGIFLLSFCGIKKAYHNENTLFLLNDYELIEQLHGELRMTYIEKTCYYMRVMLSVYMIVFPLVIFLCDTPLPFWLCMALIFLFTIGMIYKMYKYQKHIQQLLNQERV